MAKTFLEHTPATGAVAMYAFKALLKAAGWTVESSSDGTTYNSSGDQITTGASGTGGMANNSAWFRLRHPLGTMEYTVQRGTTNIAWRIKFSAGGFGAGSPGATQTPQNATDQAIILGGGTDASPTYETLFGNDNTYRHKAGVDSDTGEFWSAGFPTGGGIQNHGWIHENLVACLPADGAKWHTMIGGGAWIASGTLTAHTESGNAQRSFAYEPAATPTTMRLYPAQTNTLFPNGLATHPITSKDDAAPIMYGRSNGNGNAAYKGIGATFQWVGVARATGSTIRVNATADHMVWGDIRVFWSGNDSPET
jgi:hypothetical protein